MNIRHAILAAADHIERNPKEFDFWSVTKPTAPSCGTPGCALGWIGCFAGYSSSEFVAGVAEEMGFDDAGREFYNRMHSLSGEADWRESGQKCAIALRLYANKYHPRSVNFAKDLVSRLSCMPAIAEDAAS